MIHNQYESFSDLPHNPLHFSFDFHLMWMHPLSNESLYFPFIRNLSKQPTVFVCL